MSPFVGHIARAIETADGREAIVGVRGAGRGVTLGAVPHARRGDAVLVDAGAALAIVCAEGLPDHAGADRPPAGREDTPCA